MQHMQKLAQGMATVVAHHAILRQGGLWENGEIELRTKTLEGNFANLFAFDMLPQLRPMIFGLMAMVEGEELHRVWVSKIAPGVVHHISPEDADQLYIVVLHGLPGVVAKIGDESLMVGSGEAWWINELPLAVTNNSQDTCMLLCIRAVPNAPATYVPPEAPDANISA